MGLFRKLAHQKSGLLMREPIKNQHSIIRYKPLNCRLLLSYSLAIPESFHFATCRNTLRLCLVVEMRNSIRVIVIVIVHVEFGVLA